MIEVEFPVEDVKKVLLSVAETTLGGHSFMEETVHRLSDEIVSCSIKQLCNLNLPFKYVGKVLLLPIEFITKIHYH